MYRHLPARPESAAPLRNAVVEYAAGKGASQRLCEDIALAVSEALNNTIMHAYAGDEVTGDVMVGAWMNGLMLQVVVCDAGVGMLPRADSPGLGIGLQLIAESTQEVSVSSTAMPPGVRIRMTFAIG